MKEQNYFPFGDYKIVWAQLCIEGIDLDLDRGEILALVGGNGAGRERS